MIHAMTGSSWWVHYVHDSHKLLQTVLVLNLDITKKFEYMYFTLDELTMKGLHTFVIR
jgi:hypothetical protein